MSSRSDMPSRSVLALFAQYLLAGESPSELERICGEHPERSAELRRLVRLWCDFASLQEERATGGHEGPHSSGVHVPPTFEGESLDEDLALRTLNRVVGFAAHDRYAREGRLAHGGQGSVFRVWDRNLRRPLAMKTLHRLGERRSDAERVDSRPLARFLEEAFVTGQLDHPGIVPVHELGLDEEGHVFFTMKLVKGRDLEVVLRQSREGSSTWTARRVLDVLLRVCEALAYAHAKGVVHRDLKPANVMIGRFGEVYVMDWGLAHVLALTEAAEVRVPGGETTSYVRERAERDDEGSPCLTLDGDVVGTPAYMSPEQAEGELQGIGPWSDVYSVGAMLYEVLAGHAPYAEPGRRLTNYKVWRRVRAGPPRSLREVAPGAAPELVSICEKAMARSLAERYQDVEAFARDLRAFVEGRVVPVYRTGPLVEVRKWVGRNRLLASASAAALLALTGGGAAFAWSRGDAARIEREGREHVQELEDARMAARLVTEQGTSWAVDPASVPAVELWIASAERLVLALPACSSELDELRASALPYDDEQRSADDHARWDSDLESLRQRRDGMRELVDELSGKLERGGGTLDERVEANLSLEILEPELARLGAELDLRDQLEGGRRTWLFDRPDVQERHDVLARRVRDLRLLQHGLPGARELSERCRTLAARTIADHADDWGRALASIADVEECPAYDGLRLAPQLGLVPLGRDPTSGLWEFWHVPSGERPEREDGAWSIRPETGVVLVLVPGGRVCLGAQPEARDEPRHDPWATPSQGPPRWVVLDPYFLSKYELTKAQWRRGAGDDASEYYVGFQVAGDPRVGPTNPVEYVSWRECVDVLARWGLDLPTEAQWETAARARTEGPYPFEGVEPYGGGDALAPWANSCEGADTARHLTGPDGHIVHAPVDEFLPNPWGLVSVLGNVAEWCRDWHVATLGEKYVLAIRDGDGEILPRLSSSRSTRGGSFEVDPMSLRVTHRFHQRPGYRGGHLGVRPARSIQKSFP